MNKGSEIALPLCTGVCVQQHRGEFPVHMGTHSLTHIVEVYVSGDPDSTAVLCLLQEHSRLSIVIPEIQFTSRSWQMPHLRYLGTGLTDN